MKYAVLGPLEVSDGDRLVEVARPKERAVLGVLLVEANRVVSLDRIVGNVWGGEPPARAVGTLHAYVSNLRRLLEPGRPARAPSQVLVSRPPGYCLVTGPDDIDAARFERLAAEGRALIAAGRPLQARERLDDALGLWRGPAYADFAYDDFAAPAARRLEELRSAAVEDRIETELALGRPEQAVAELEARLADEPLRERMWAQLMVALYRVGRQAEALGAYRRARAALDELGLEPGPALRDLERAVLNQSPVLDTPAPPVQAVEVPEPRRPAESARPPLVGREAERQTLDTVLADVARGAGRVVVVSGEAGVGKTTLVTEALRRAVAQGTVTAFGRCPEGRHAPTLWPWRQVLRELAPDAPDLGVGDDEHETSPASHARLFREVLAALRTRSAQQPVVIVLDDVQWADEVSHHLLQLAVVDLLDVPVLLAVTLRDPSDGGGPALADTLSAVARAPHAVHLRLAGLDRAATARLVAELSGAEPSPDVVDVVHLRTGGNPFFTTQLVRLLDAERAIGDARAIATAGVPAGVRDVIRRRLARLPDQANAVLAVAAVVGPDVDVRLVEALTGLDSDTLLDLFELAAVAGVLAERPDRPGVYRFSHDLVREAVRDGLPGMRRARLHQRAVGALEALHGPGARSVAHEIAHHALHAVPVTGPTAAVPHLLTSARAALIELALELSERQLRGALDLLEQMSPSPERDAFELQVQARLSQVLFHSRTAGESAMAHYRRALELSGDDAAARAGVLLNLGAYGGLRGDLAASLDAGRELLRLAEHTHDVTIADWGHYVMSFLVWAGEPDEARRHLEESIRLAPDHEQPRNVLGWTGVPLPTKQAALGLAVALLGAADAAGDALSEAVRLARLRRNEWALSWAGTFGAVAHVVRDDPTAVLELAGIVREEAAGLDYTDAVVEGCAAWAAARVGDAPGAAEVIRDARAVLEATGGGVFATVLAGLEADVLLDRGNVDAALRLLDATRVTAQRGGETTWLPRLEALTERARRAPSALPR